MLVGSRDDKGCLHPSLAEEPEIKLPAALTVEQFIEGTCLLPGKIFSICPPHSSKQKKEEQAAGRPPQCDAGQINHGGCHRRGSMSEQFPRVYFGPREGGCLWEEAVVNEAKQQSPPQLRDGDSPHFFKLYHSLKSLRFTLISENSPDFAIKIRLV